MVQMAYRHFTNPFSRGCSVSSSGICWVVAAVSSLAVSSLAAALPQPAAVSMSISHAKVFAAASYLHLKICSNEQYNTISSMPV